MALNSTSLEGRTYADVALELRCSVAAVHRRLVRAQTHLRRRLAQIGGQCEILSPPSGGVSVRLNLPLSPSRT